MHSKKLVFTFCIVGLLAGCADLDRKEQGALSGAALGAAGGALIGHMAKGTPLRGAAWGAGAGAAGGYLYQRQQGH